jgi:epoxyqueuosine reductase QueG
VNGHTSQESCPWNSEKFVQITDEPAFHAREGLDGPALIELMGLSQEEFSARFRKSPVKRTKRRGLLRNVGGRARELGIAGGGAGARGGARRP